MQEPVDDRAIVSLIAGIVAVMFSFQGPTSWVCLVAGLIAVNLRHGRPARRQRRTGG